MITFSCSQCRTTLQVNNDLAGKKALCPCCKHLLRIPGPPASLEVTLASYPAQPALEATRTWLMQDSLAGVLGPQVPAAFFDPPQAADELGRVGDFRVLRLL